MTETSIQEVIPDNHCWGCGPLNPDGLHIHSHPLGNDEAVCHYTPGPAFMAGPTHVVNGGLLATLVDCHCVCSAIADAYRAEGRAPGETPQLWYATASLRLDYLRPTPLGTRLTLHATIVERGPRKRRLRCTIEAEGVRTVEAEVVAVRVPDAWRRPESEGGRPGGAA